MKKPEQIEPPRPRTGGDTLTTTFDGIAVAWGLGYTFDGTHRAGKVSGWWDAGTLRINGVDYTTYGEIKSYSARVWDDEHNDTSTERAVPVQVYLQLRRGTFGDPTPAARKAVDFLEDAMRARVIALTDTERDDIAAAACEHEAERAEERARIALAEAAAYRALRPRVLLALAEALTEQKR